MNQAEALALSLLIEVPVAVAVGRAMYGAPEEGWRRLMFTAFAATLLTHPFAWNGWQMLRPYTAWWGRALAVEGSVTAVEALLYWRLAGLEPRAASITSAAANAASFGMGLFVMRVLLA